MLLLDQLLDRVDIGDDCWSWSGSTWSDGYGRFADRPAHREAYELLVGPIPEGLTLDHLCRNRGCVNPDHLEPVTMAENIRRSPVMQGTRTHCKRGHLRAEHQHPKQGCIACKKEGRP